MGQFLQLVWWLVWLVVWCTEVVMQAMHMYSKYTGDWWPLYSHTSVLLTFWPSVSCSPSKPSKSLRSSTVGNYCHLKIQFWWVSHRCSNFVVVRWYNNLTLILLCTHQVSTTKLPPHIHLTVVVSLTDTIKDLPMHNFSSYIYGPGLLLLYFYYILSITM